MTVVGSGAMIDTWFDADVIEDIYLSWLDLPLPPAPWNPAVTADDLAAFLVWRDADVWDD